MERQRERERERERERPSQPTTISVTPDEVPDI